MSEIRAFIAVDLSAQILERIAQVSARLQEQGKNLPVRWVPTDNIHLTLKFLGNVSLANLDVLKNSLIKLAERFQPCEIGVGSIGAFPKLQRPRVIWIGLEVSPELIALQRGIDLETVRLGYQREDRRYSPHLTIGRVKHNASAQEIRLLMTLIEGTKVGLLGTLRIEDVHLYRSELKPGGAVYTRIFTAPLHREPVEPHG